MADELKSGQKPISDMIEVTFDSPQAKDDFLRKLAGAKSKDAVAELLIGDTDGKVH